MKKVKHLKSYRFSIARGWYWYNERAIHDEVEGILWLGIFQHDEPSVEFKIE